MAKASKKNQAKPAGSKAILPAKKKFSIDLRKIELNDEKRFQLLSTIHKAVGSIIKTEIRKQKEIPLKLASLKASATEGGTATISATFLDAEPGFSELTATHKGNSETIKQTGKISFDNVKAGEIIRVEVMTLGKSEITIDRTAKPQEKKTSDSSFRFSFEILK